jgi:DNA (cytosine-5)-methyltransferase 3A
MKKKNVLSLFDGMSCCQLALKRAKIDIDNYYASEVESEPISVTMKNFPKTIHLGDVRDIDSNNIDKIFLLAAGSPCQGFSMSGLRKGMVTLENIEVTTLKQYLKLKKQGFEFHGQSYLFWEFIRLLKELKPKYFLLENVRMDKKWEKIITDVLQVKPIKINSNLMSAQNRERLYWTNIPGVSQPKDEKIMLTDVIPDAISIGKRGVWCKVEKKYIQTVTARQDGKANCVVTTRNSTNQLIFSDGTVRYYTPEEAEMLQTLPKNYTNIKGISMTRRYKMIGNGWTVKVASHILKNIKKDLVK